jgi:hypothetical protein
MPGGRGECGFERRRSTAGAETAVERREAPRARSRRFAQADRSVARATPEARTSGNIRPRGVATTLGAFRRSTPALRGAVLLGMALSGMVWQSSDAKTHRENEMFYAIHLRVRQSTILMLRCRIAGMGRCKN